MSNFAFLLPDVTPISRPYWDGLAAGQLRLQHCRACGAYQYPPESFCYECPATDLEWRTVEGRGTIYSFIVVHQLYHPAFAERVPYVVATVQLDEGPRLLAALFEEGARVAIGARVHPRIEPIADGRSALFFALESGS